MTAPAPDLTRLSVNMNRETTELLRTFANERGLTYTEAIRRCISIGSYVAGEIAEGNEVRIVEPGHGGREYRKLVLL